MPPFKYLLMPSPQIDSFDITMSPTEIFLSNAPTEPINIAFLHFVPPSAIIAIARMLLTALYNMLKKMEPYNSELYKKSDVIPVTREITVEQAVLMAQSQGYKIKSATA